MRNARQAVSRLRELLLSAGGERKERKMNEKIFERKDVYVYFVDGKPYINLSNRCTNNCVFA